MDEPIITTQEETVHVNPQLNAQITSPSQRKELDDSFQDFCAEQDAKEEGSRPPESPAREPSTEPVSEQPAPEPKKTKAERKRKPADIPEVTEEEAASEIDELEKYQPHPQSSQTVRNDFKGLKSAARTFKQKAQAWETLSPALQELGIQIPDNPKELASVLQDAKAKISGLKNGALPEAVTKELEELRALAVSVGILRSKAFTDQFVTPRDRAYHDVIDEMALYFDAPQEQIKKDFLDPLKKDFTPSQLPSEWWQQQTELMTKASPPIKRKIEQKIANLLLMQEQHDRAANEFAGSPKTFYTWEEGKRREADEAFGRAVQARVEATLEKVSPFYFELRRKVLAGDKSAIAEFQPTEDKFRNFLNIVRSGNPEATTDIATQFVEMERRLAELSNVHDELKEAQAEIAELRRTETKKRKLSDAPMRSGSGKTSTPQKEPLPHSASKSLASAFESWRL
jgi:hypothetical protein